MLYYGYRIIFPKDVKNLFGLSEVGEDQKEKEKDLALDINANVAVLNSTQAKNVSFYVCEFRRTHMILCGANIIRRLRKIKG